jgi:glycosyltransferase involved in cell wall biosynthesis
MTPTRKRETQRLAGMILGVNGIRLVRNRSGVARAIEAILHELDRPGSPFTEMKVYTPEPLEPGVSLPSSARNVVLGTSLPYSLWEQVTLPRGHGTHDVLFCPSYISPWFARCPTLVVHHGSYEGFDRRAEVYSWWPRVKARIGYQLSALTATEVSTVSDFSRRDMARFYGVNAERIHVIPEGVDTRLFRSLDDARQLRDWRVRVLGADHPFLLYVGKPTKRRNLPSLLLAFSRLRRNPAFRHKLVLIGMSLPGTSIDAEIHALGLRDSVVVVPHAPHAEVALAYNACSIMLYPSSYEGFGMPVLEAMACGAPVIALDNTAFPEFASGVAKLLPDADPRTLETAILELLSDEPERARMRHLGPQRAAAYDWSIVGQRYLDILARLARSSR